MYMPSLLGETLFDDFFEGFNRPVAKKNGRYAATASSVMKTDITEKEKSFELAIDLPGYKKEDVTAELKDGYLTITATRKVEEDNSDEKKGFVRRERFYGTSSRSFYVGEDMTQEDIKAKFADGVLNIIVPKLEAKPKVEENRYISIEG